MVTKVSAIILDREGNLLLQLRDEEPEKNTWVPFGGGVEDGETEEQAMLREIKEELGYKIKTLVFFKRYKHSDGTEQPFFIVQEAVSLNQLTLHEGSDMKFFKPKEIEGLKIGFNYKKILLDFINSGTQERIGMNSSKM